MARWLQYLFNCNKDNLKWLQYLFNCNKDNLNSAKKALLLRLAEKDVEEIYKTLKRKVNVTYEESVLKQAKRYKYESKKDPEIVSIRNALLTDNRAS